MMVLVIMNVIVSFMNKAGTSFCYETSLTSGMPIISIII